MLYSWNIGPVYSRPASTSTSSSCSSPRLSSCAFSPCIASSSSSSGLICDARPGCPSGRP
eukprot:688562-Prymnesium_polylepis.1